MVTPGDYPVAVFLDLRTDPMSRVLDWLIARRDIPPIAAAFVGPKIARRRVVLGRLVGGVRHRTTADVAPVAARRCRSADAHAILAISYGAKDALEIALRNPDAFRRLGLLIPGRRINRADIVAIAGHRDARLRVAILAGRYDHANLPTARACGRRSPTPATS